MSTLYHNISGELTQELVAPGDGITVNRISLANIQKVSNCKADLYIEKRLTGRYYLIRNVEIPNGVTLILDNFTNFNTAAGEFGLYIKLTDGDSFELTGDINPGNGTTTVPGTNTIFISEVSVGDDIEISGETRTVTDIITDVSLTVSATYSDDLTTDTTPTCNPTALVDVIIN